MEWISTLDKMPELDKPVLIHAATCYRFEEEGNVTNATLPGFDDIHVAMLFSCYEGHCWRVSFSTIEEPDFIDEDVTHWMELPIRPIHYSKIKYYP